MMQTKTQQAMRMIVALVVIFLLSLASVFAIPITLNSSVRSVSVPGYLVVNTTTPGPYVINAAGSVNADALCISGNCQASWASLGNTTSTITANYIPIATGSSVLGNSIIYNNGGNIGIGTTGASTLLHVRSGGAAPLTVESTTANSYINLVTSSGTAEISGSGAGVLYLGGNAAQPIYIRNSGYSTRQTITATGLVGINTTAPSSTLDVKGNVSLVDSLYIPSNGNIGMGTSNPQAKLHILGAGGIEPRIQSSNNYAGITLIGGQASDGANGYGIYSGYPSAGNFAIAENGVATRILLQKTTGNVGIGSATPGEKLAVAGNLSTTTGAFLATSSGNVGVGTTNPLAKLHVSAGSMLLDNNQGFQWRAFATGTATDVIKVTNTNVLTLRGISGAGVQFVDGGNMPLVTVTGSGSIGIGTTAPLTRLHVAGNHTDEAGDRAAQTVLTLDTITSAGGVGKSYFKTGWDNSVNQGILTLGVGYFSGTVQTRDVMTLKGSGNVGIGISPDANVRLQISESNQHLSILTNRRLAGSWPPSAEANTMTLQSSGSVAGNLAFATGNNEVMRITSGGSVGIGDISPDALLDLESTNPAIIIQDSDSTGDAQVGYISLRDNTGTERMWIGDGSAGNDDLTLSNGYAGGHIVLDPGVGDVVAIPQNTWINGATGVNLIRDSYFGYSTSYRATQIGTVGATRAISLGADLTSNAASSFAGNEIVIPNNRAIIGVNAANNGYIGVMRLGADNSLYIGGADYQTLGRVIIDTSGNVGIGVAPSTYLLRVGGSIGASSFWFTSDANLKKNIQPLDATNTVSKVLALNPVTFEWKNTTAGGKGTQIGLVAQDVEKVYPELVSTADDGTKSVSYANLVAPLIATAQAQQKQIDAQQQQIDLLRAEIEALKAERK